MYDASIRLVTMGGTQVKADFESIAQSGDASAKRYARAFQRAGEDAEAALARQANAARKLDLLRPGLNAEKLDSFAGVRDQVGKSAAESASVFSAEYAKMEARAEALLRAIDPARQAQARFNATIGEARALVSAGTLSLDEYVSVLRVEQNALDQVAMAQGRAGVSANAHRAAMTGLSYQAQDAFTQMSMGANVLSVIAIQGAQAAGQMANMGGKVGAVAAVLAGPWGLAVSGGLMLLGALTKGLLDGGDAADTKKAAVKSLAEAIDDLAEATGRQIKSEQQSQAETLRSAGAYRQKALDARAATVETLRLARANLSAALTRANDPTLAGEGGFNPGAVAASRFASQAAMLDATLKTQEQALAKANIAFRQAEVPGFQRRVAESFDASAAATGRYERAVDKLNARYGAGRITQVQYQSQLAGLTRERNTAIDAAKEADRSERKVGDGHRSASGHARAAAAATRELAAAQRELASDLDDVTRRFDPARAAANDFEATMKKISVLRSAGKISAGDAAIYQGRVIEQDNERATKERAEATRKLFGIDDDPLGDMVKRYDTDREAQYHQETANWEQFQQKRESDVQRLAGLFQTGFSGGAKGIWREFEQMGLQTISTLLARWVLGSKGGGTDASGLTSLLGGIGKLFGKTGNNAAGTEYWSGGMSLVGEAGPEIVSMPQGSRVTTAAETRRLFANSNADPRRLKVDIGLNTPLFTAQVSDTADSRIGQAAPGIASGGAELGRMRMGQARRRQLGRRAG